MSNSLNHKTICTSQSDCFIKFKLIKGKSKGKLENRKERKMEITYSKYGDYYLPDLAILEEESATYGRFGRMRLKYLKEHHRATYINLKTSGQLTHHLNEIDHEANEMLRLLIEQMAQAQGVTEQLKEDQMAWVGAMNNIRSAEEEVVMQDVIFA